MINFFLSFFYALGRFAFGLLVHPYQTMQLLVRQKMFVWVVLTPTFLLGIPTLAWNALLSLAAPVLSIDLFWLDLAISFLSTWITVFVVYWQIILLYLLARFRFAQ
jgi:hypothetical protein